MREYRCEMPIVFCLEERRRDRKGETRTRARIVIAQRKYSAYELKLSGDEDDSDASYKKSEKASEGISSLKRSRQTKGAKMAKQDAVKAKTYS